MRGRALTATLATALLCGVATTDAAGAFPARGASASHATIRTWMRRTVEVGAPQVHFRQISHKVVVSDGRGGTLTAAIGVRSITADGHGQLVFFFHGGHFLGWDSNFEIASIQKITAAGPRRFDVTYSHYAADDPLCCPSLSPKTVRYRWTGRRIPTLARRPHDPGAHIRVELAR